MGWLAGVVVAFAVVGAWAVLCVTGRGLRSAWLWWRDRGEDMLEPLPSRDWTVRPESWGPPVGVRLGPLVPVARTVAWLEGRLRERSAWAVEIRAAYAALELGDSTFTRAVAASVREVVR